MSLILLSFLIFSLFLLIILSLGVSLLFSKIAQKYQILDNPKSAPNRKFQTKPIPLIGGSGFVLLICFYIFLLQLEMDTNFLGLSHFLQTNLFFPINLYSIIIGNLGLLVLGFLDDKYDSPSLFHALSVILVIVGVTVFSELKIEAFSYPFDQLDLKVFFLPKILTFLWILSCVAASKFLDGHDGLLATVALVNFLSIAAVSNMSHVAQPLLLILSIVYVCNILGFLFWNFPEAKIYLGEGSSLVLGFNIGIFSILSGAKIATSSLVLGWFILDINLVFLIRLIRGINPLQADSHLHWHHRLKNLGFTKIQVLIITTLVILLTTHLGLALTTYYKAWVLIVQILLMSFIFLLKIFNPKS